MPANRNMQNRIIAIVVTALIISSCYVIQGPDRTESELNPTNEYHSISDDNAEFKIHRPGEAIDSPETLEWSPNNLTELATMQFTILLDNNLPLDTIEQIDIIGAWISNSGQAFEQFQESITGFTINQGPDIASIVINYTYPSQSGLVTIQLL